MLNWEWKMNDTAFFTKLTSWQNNDLKKGQIKEIILNSSGVSLANSIGTGSGARLLVNEVAGQEDLANWVWHF